MSAGALAAATTPTQKPFVIKVGGLDVTSIVPLGDFPVHITETTDGAAQLTFTIEDNDQRQFGMGSLVEVLDKRSGTRTLFGGHLVNMRHRRRAAGYGRLIDCAAIGLDAWLDWRTVISWSSRNSKTGSLIQSDRVMVQQLVDKYGGRRVVAPDATVQATNTNMEKVIVKGATLREAIQRVADTATTSGDSTNRYFYVDVDGRLHYFLDQENDSAPYRIADGFYTRTVLETSGLVALWTMREPSGTVAHETAGGYHGTFSGAAQRGVTGGLANEPQLTATLFDGATGYMAASGAALHPGDTFSFECWYKRSTTGTRQSLITMGDGDIDVRFDTTSTIQIGKQNVSTVWTTDGTFTDTSSWHHLVVTKNGSTRRVYVDGTERSGSGANATMVAAAGDINVARRVGDEDRYFAGSLQHVALYDVALSAATVLAHYQQGVSIWPEDLVLERDASDGREEVYVAGKNDAGTGWVRPGDLPGVTLRSSFGRDEPPRWEIVEREDSTGPDKKRSYGGAFLKRHNDPQVSGSFSVTDFDGWRVGQRVYVTDAALGLDAYPIEVKQLETDLLLGNGTIRYDITLGRNRRTATRNLNRSLPRKR